MNKVLSIILVMAMAFSLTACEERDGASEPSSSQDISSSSQATSSSEPEKKPESSSSSEPVVEDAYLAEMYYDYFSQHNFISVLFYNDAQEGFSDEAMGSYAICYLIANNPDYDFEKGSKLSDFDAVTEKYFGKKLKEYESDLITLMPDDHIASTGWGISPCNMVLKEIKTNPDGTKTGTFYVASIPMEGPDAQTIKQALLKGDFYGYNGIKLIELTFEETIDDTRAMYLKLLSSKNLGEAQKPYKVYGVQ